ncbi:uncharacterized protein C11orf98 homolog isoform X2 [Scyliorhinus canicula]|uniref:uncharacterized protein C11orf98 homolog isoform X2 n=1 Tax=Scyliorhinus canicula TaxID=7830 RepID=UPI0018F47F51|nr:uncharacterized protein C11orf98 homolog isoform X2 [Scyliorhinus canicula]
MVHGGQSNPPKSESRGNVLKGRRVSRKEKRKKPLIVGAVVDQGLTTIHHLKKRCSSKRANITLSGKKKRKLQKQIRHSQRERSAMDDISTGIVTSGTEASREERASLLYPT